MKKELIKTWRKFGATLRLYDTFDRSSGKTRLAYKLTSARRVIFDGNDFYCSPLHADDSVETIAALLDFLTLQPGDTDAEYFEKYTPEQLEWIASDQADSVRLWLYEKHV